MTDDLDKEFKKLLHFKLPNFYSEFKNYNGYKESLSTVKDNYKLLFSITYKESDVYKSMLLEWDSSTLFSLTVSDYDVISEMRNSKLTINDIEHINKDELLKQICHESKF